MVDLSRVDGRPVLQISGHSLLVLGVTVNVVDTEYSKALLVSSSSSIKVYTH